MATFDAIHNSGLVGCCHTIHVHALWDFNGALIGLAMVIWASGLCGLLYFSICGALALAQRTDVRAMRTAPKCRLKAVDTIGNL